MRLAQGLSPWLQTRIEVHKAIFDIPISPDLPETQSRTRSGLSPNIIYLDRILCDFNSERIHHPPGLGLLQNQG